VYICRASSTREFHSSDPGWPAVGVVPGLELEIHDPLRHARSVEPLAWPRPVFKSRQKRALFKDVEQNPPMAIAAWTWYDLSPTDGCTLVEYLAAAESADELARLASQNPVAQSRTVRRLLTDGRAHRITGADAERALAQVGHVLWRGDDSLGWRRI
jgi:hypothetical protein